MKLAKQVLDIYEMANLRQPETGLRRIIWVATKSGREKHGPRIKVQKDTSRKINNGEWVSVTIADDPKIVGGQAKDLESDFKEIKEFIVKHKVLLLKYWKGTITTTDLLMGLK
jgi:hypothetical protein